MDKINTANAIRAELAKLHLASSQIDVLATPEFRAALDPALLAKAEAAKLRMDKAQAAFHRALRAAGKPIAPQFGDAK